MRHRRLKGQQNMLCVPRGALYVRNTPLFYRSRIIPAVLSHFNPYNAEIFCMQHGDQSVFFQFIHLGI